MTRNARIAPLVARAFSALGITVLACLAAALVGGAWPSNAGWRPPVPGSRDTVTIWVEATAIHTDLVLPKRAAGVDWRRFAPAGDLADPRYAVYDHLAIGWGERAFFLDTPTWRDVRPRVVVHALIGSGDTLLHVEHVPGPATDAAGVDVRPIVLTVAQYRRLARFIVASRRTAGKRYRGYGPNDAFYDAQGRYDLIRTCNSWTGDALRHAGVRIGRWTPLPVTVTGWF